jgi:hypothetical protein
MTLASASSRAPTQTRTDRRALFAYVPTALIALAAIALQARLGAVDDVSWLITASERTLDGQVPYKDFLEVNPPASILMYLPPVYLARLLGLAPELMVAVFGFIGIAASLALSAAILARAGLVEKFGAIGVALTLFALTLLPAHAFDERDHIAAIAGLPFLAVAAARGGGGRVDWRLALLAGIGAGIMASIKPPYALAAMALAPYLAARLGPRALFSSVEYYVAALVGIGYALATVLFFPAFVSDVIPLANAVYLPVRESPLNLVLNTGVVLWLALFLASAQMAGNKCAEPLFAIPALASLGALASFFIQGKGWSYQIYPALAFAIVALGAALAARGREASPLLAAVGCAIAAALIALVIGRWPVQIMIGVAGAAAVLTAAAQRLSGSPPSGRGPLSEMIASSAIGVALAMFASEGLPQPVLAKALAQLGPHPTMLAISESLAFGHPLVREVGGVWAQRVPSLWITAAADRLIRESHDNPLVQARLAPLMRADREMLLQDIAANRPDAILVGRIGGPVYNALWADPAIVAALADYRFFASNDDPDWPAFVYARRDPVGLRVQVDDGTQPPKAAP